MYWFIATRETGTDGKSHPARDEDGQRDDEDGQRDDEDGQCDDEDGQCDGEDGQCDGVPRRRQQATLPESPASKREPEIKKDRHSSSR